MIRIHDLSNAFYVSLGAQQPSGGVFYYAMVPVYYADGDRPLEVSVDLFDDDIFGEEIHYGSPKFHKWSSIRHFKTEADIIPITRSMADSLFRPQPGRKVNVLNPSNPTNPLLIPFDIKVGGYFLGDFARANAQHEGTAVAKATRHLFYGTDFFNVHNSHGDFYCVSILTYSVYNRNGHYSYSYYRDLEYTSTGMTVFLWKWKDSHKSSLGTLKKGGLRTCYVTLGPDEVDDFGIVRRTVREWTQLHAGDTGSDATGFRNLSNFTSLKSAMPVSSISVHRPNYDAIFASNRRNPNWYELAAQAYQSLGMSDINGVAYITELFSMGEEVIKFSRTLKSIPSSKVKAVASAWLAVHYGFKLTLLDTKTLRDTLEKEASRLTRESKCQSALEYHYEDIRFVARYQVFYNQFAHLLRTLDQLVELTDAALTSENLWDMVPFSFVIDWFVRLGDVLQSLDNFSNLIQKHEVVAAGKSIKGECLGKASQLGLPAWLGDQHIKLTCYLRRYERHLQSPSLVPSVTVNPFNHLIEGAALVISRK